MSRSRAFARTIGARPILGRLLGGVLLFVVVVLPGAVAGEPVAVRYTEGLVHGFLVLAITPRPEGYTLYMAVYVSPMSRFTPFYMALIDPFRRFIVYPALCRDAQRSWSRAYK